MLGAAPAPVEDALLFRAPHRDHAAALAAPFVSGDVLRLYTARLASDRTHDIGEALARVTAPPAVAGPAKMASSPEVQVEATLASFQRPAPSHAPAPLVMAPPAPPASQVSIAALAKGTVSSELLTRNDRRRLDRLFFIVGFIV